MAAYDALAVESKWRARWEQDGAHRARLDQPGGERCYCLVMFSYPSGNKLHLGHWFNYGPTDSWARFRRMQGAQVFQPMGFDSFGLPAENYAIKMQVHPREHTEKNIAFMQEQLRVIGAMYDWDHEVQTHRPAYYRWTQWLFLKLLEGGYAYRRNAPVNWCDSCQTVLANEQVVGGLCERCDHPVRRRDLTQWFFRITAFADELLEGLERIDWPHKTVAMQRNWIGRSEGANLRFALAGDHEGDIEVYTTRPDTVFGATYMVLAPEHPRVAELTHPDRRAEVEAYQEQAARASEIERSSTAREKSGVPLGTHVVNPATGEEIPVWIADYVLAGYGSGAVMAVPAHDERDFDFATRFGLPIRRVVIGPDGADGPLPEAFTGEGPLVGSGRFDGLAGAAAREAIVAHLEAQGRGEATVNTRLRDWLVSRQRYWGAPIPVIHCGACGEVPVPEDQLPVELPEDVEFMPTGESPLRRHPTWKDVDCPSCGGPAERDCDTMDTFVDSSWYFLRYLSPRDAQQAWDPQRARAWMPVDQYVGGAEHAVMHLLYARFITRALHRMGLCPVDEPFQRLVHQGVITRDGARMSKSRGNVVNPEEYLERFGSDTLRAYLMFGFSYVDGGDWDDSGIEAMHKYLVRVHRLVDEEGEGLHEAAGRGPGQGEADEELRYTRHNSIKGATQDIARFQFNTAIARHMELTNALWSYVANVPREAWSRELWDAVLDWARLLAPLAPHLGEELWAMLGQEGSVFDAGWPQHDEGALQRRTVTVVVQVNGKVREQMPVAPGTPAEQLSQLALEYGKIPQWTEGKPARVVKVIEDKLVSIVA